MRGIIDELPYEVFVLCIAFAIDGQPTGPLEYTMVSKRWEQLLLSSPSLWDQIYIQNGEDEMARISTFLHLSQKHPLHVDLMTVIPNMDSVSLIAVPDMDSLQLIARNISRVATISIRPGPTETITSFYMEQWKRSASYILATLYNNLRPSQVLSDVDNTQSPALILREGDHSFYWVIFMQLTMRAQIDPLSMTSTGGWTHFRRWENYIRSKRTIRHSAVQADRGSSINLHAGYAYYAQYRDAIRVAMPAFVMLLKEDDHGDSDSNSNFNRSVQVAARDALNKFTNYVELHDALKLALIDQLGHPTTQIGTSVIPEFVKLVHYAELRGSMILSLPLLLELFDDPNFDTQMSTISALKGWAEHVKFDEHLKVAISSLTERLRNMNAETRQSTISVLKGLAACSDFKEVLRVASLPLIDLLGDADPKVQISALNVVWGLNIYANSDHALRGIILSRIGRLGDKDAGIRAATISIIQSSVKYDGFNAALRAFITSLVEQFGDKDPGVRTSAVSALQRLADCSEPSRYVMCRFEDEFEAAVSGAIPSVIKRLGDMEPGVRTSAVFIVESLAKYDGFRAALKVVIPPLIEHLGDMDPRVTTSAISVVQSLAIFYECRAKLGDSIPSLVERLGDKDPGVRASAISFVQCFANYNEFRAKLKVAIPSLIERLGDKDPGVKTSAVSVVQRLAGYRDFDAALRIAIPSLIELLEDQQLKSPAYFILDKLGHHSEHIGDANGKDNKAGDLEVDVFHGASAGAHERRGEDNHGLRMTDFISDVHPPKRRRTSHTEVHAKLPMPDHRVHSNIPHHICARSQGIDTFLI